MPSFVSYRRTVGERAMTSNMAAIALHQGAIAEQRTGEGKAFGFFPAYLNALSGKGFISSRLMIISPESVWLVSKALHLWACTAGIIHSNLCL